jgi:hypothetical protein
MGILTWLQGTALAQWVAGSGSLLAYPLILFLHTFGLSILVGPSTVIDLRLLGMARETSLVPMGKLFRLMWVGFIVNAITGTLLFISDAEAKGHQWIFGLKLALVAVGLILLAFIRPYVDGKKALAENEVSTQGKQLAVLSLIVWTGVIAAGRLMAYVK